MRLCFLEDPDKHFTDPATYSTWIKDMSLEDKKIVKEFSQSMWLKVDPATESIIVK